AITLPAHLGSRDVAAEEGIVRAVAHDRDRRHRLAVQPAYQETCWVHSMERPVIGPARVPALVSGPVADHADVVGARRRNLEPWPLPLPFPGATRRPWRCWRRTGCPAVAGRGFRARCGPRTRCGTGRGAAAQARPD